MYVLPWDKRIAFQGIGSRYYGSGQPCRRILLVFTYSVRKKTREKVSVTFFYRDFWVLQGRGLRPAFRPAYKAEAYAFFKARCRGLRPLKRLSTRAAAPNGAALLNNYAARPLNIGWYHIKLVPRPVVSPPKAFPTSWGVYTCHL